MQHGTMNQRVLWSNIEACLDSRHVHWRERVATFGQVRAVQDRSQGRVWSDDQVLKAVLLAVLSSNTVWSKVERVLPDLSELFDNFSLEAYAGHSDTAIDNRFVPWFMGRKAGSMSLRGGLVNLAHAARILLRHSKRHGSADDYFTSLVHHQCADDPKQAAMRLGSQGEHKLPSLGVALAAEALKNLGFDVAKPDRHMMRAVGSFGLVRFNRWKPADGRWKSPKSQSGNKLLEVMTVAEQVADAAERHVANVDNAIWLLCARDEVHLTNAQLAGIANKAGLPNVPAVGVGDDRRSGGKTQRDGKPAGPPRRTTSEERASTASRPSRSSAPGTGADPDYSVYNTWDKASEKSRTLYRELKTLVEQLGSVRTDVAKTVISFKCTAAPGQRAPVLAYVYLTVKSGLRVLVHEKHVRHISLEDGFTRPNDGGKYRQIVIRDREHIRRAEPLLHAAYNILSGSAA